MSDVHSLFCFRDTLLSKNPFSYHLGKQSLLMLSLPKLHFRKKRYLNGNDFVKKASFHSKSWFYTFHPFVKRVVSRPNTMSRCSFHGYPIWKHLPFVIFCDQNTKYIRPTYIVRRRTELLKMREIIERRVVAARERNNRCFVPPQKNWFSWQAMIFRATFP